MADWLDRGKVHPCCFENAYAGFEVMMACSERGARRPGDAPLADGTDELEELRRAVSSAPPPGDARREPEGIRRLRPRPPLSARERPASLRTFR